MCYFPKNIAILIKKITKKKKYSFTNRISFDIIKYNSLLIGGDP